ncbi:MAG: hypothetical protein CYPHOPRED_004843 [Cyphobasidiales sp. Tagirdzhanova-0007]|nr:MAG: hypothetical protein CYPHOPRED_004843 [Cyphobasidiales sp. Tagirdzhanova-0007]
MGMAVRSIRKIGDWKAAEFRTFITQDLLPFIYSLRYTQPEVYEFIETMVIMTRLLEGTAITPSLEEVSKEELAHMPEDGIWTVSQGSLRYYVGRFIELREKMFYGRDARFLARIAIPTHHRISHMPEDRILWGPGSNYSQWSLEGIIGDETRKARSRRFVVKNIANNAVKRNALLLLRLRFDNIPPVKAASQAPTTTSILIPNTTLLHPRRLRVILKADESALLMAYRRQTRWSTGVLDTIGKWSRSQLSNGTVVRSSWSEGDVLPGQQEEDELAPRYAARFAKISIHTQVHCIVEVLFFLEVKTLQPTSSRLLALVKSFEEAEHSEPLFIVVKLNGRRRTFFVGVEQIRHTVDLKHLDGERDLLAATHKAGQNATPYTQLETA